MGFVVALGNIRQLSIGRFEFRKRIPERHKVRIGQGEFKRVFRAFTPAEIAREHARVQAEFEAILAGKIAEQSGNVVEAVRPAAPAPKPRQNPPQKTFADAVALYERDKLENGRNTKGCTTLKRVCERMETALKVRLNDLKLTEVTREDARKVRDHMLGLRKKAGGTLSPESVKRDMVILSAMTTYALTEFGLDGEHRNPFAALPIPKNKESQIRAIERRDTLPDDVVAAMTLRLSGELNHIWRILAGTGCRLAEVTGLRTQDVRIASEEIPHIRVTWHEGRRVKTASSIRSVPLVGDALNAAKEALSAAGQSPMLFSRYAHPRGADAASAILMKHLRGVTLNPKHVVHSLRHRMKDKLRIAGVSKEAQDLILGHAAPSVSDSYGSDQGRLIMAYKSLTCLADTTKGNIVCLPQPQHDSR